MVSFPEHYLEDQVGTAWKRSLSEDSRLPRKRPQKGKISGTDRKRGAQPSDGIARMASTGGTGPVPVRTARSSAERGAQPGDGAARTGCGAKEDRRRQDRRRVQEERGAAPSLSDRRVGDAELEGPWK